jgi:hypothetical protein
MRPASSRPKVRTRSMWPLTLSARQRGLLPRQRFLIAKATPQRAVPPSPAKAQRA